MHGMSGGLMIATHEARDACKGEKDITERVRKAMRATHGHWMETNEQEQFRAAVAAAMLESEADERDRIQCSFEQLKKLSAMLGALQAGVPVDLEKMAAEPPPEDVIPLRKLWDETRSDKR